MAHSAEIPLYTSDGDSPTTPAVKKRHGGSGRDMLYSMAILLVPVVIALGAWHFLTSDRQVNTVDPASAIAQARQPGRFTVIAPHGLADDWHATSAATTVKGTVVTLRIGYVTPSGGFAQLVESNEDAAKLLSDAVPAGARPTGAEHVAGRDWARYNGDKNHQVLALMEPHRTVLVVGQTTDAELRTLITALP